MQHLIMFIVYLELGASIRYYVPQWTYDDETTWPGNNCINGGKRQSPIDIRLSDVVMDFHKKFIKHGPLQFVGYKKVLMSGVNNGHTVQFSSDGDDEIHPTLTGGPLKHRYRLEQMHFHWLSEHAIDGEKYPMEIHFVHIRTDLTVPKALKTRDGLAIVATFCNVQAELEEYQEEASEEVMQHIPNLMNLGDRVSGVLIDITKLLSPNIESYYTYTGSLTSPECNEAVIWIIFDTPLYFTDVQYRMFTKIGIGRHNFRSLQKLRQQVVFQPPNSSTVKAPRLLIMITDMMTAVAQFFKNITNFMSTNLKIGR